MTRFPGEFNIKNQSKRKYNTTTARSRYGFLLHSCSYRVRPAFTYLRARYLFTEAVRAFTRNTELYFVNTTVNLVTLTVTRSSQQK